MNVRTKANLFGGLCGLLLAFCCLLVPQDGLAQSGKITGVVTDAQTGGPLSGAQVYLEGVGVGTLSSENGRFFLINVEPGVYTVAVELIGYQTMRRQGVLVAIDVTRTLDFVLTPQAIAVEEVRVEVEAVPLVDVTTTGTRDVFQASDLADIPVKNLNEVLRLRQGFLVVPQNTDLLSFQDTRRALTPLRIRGGRAGETLTLIDGIPINNFVFGGPSFDLTNMAYEQIDFIRGGYEPQYGNALSGIINIATREASTQLRGALEYQTSQVGGAMGIDHDELLGYDQWDGYVSGPVPGTKDKFRFVVAGRQSNGADRVLEFDDITFDPQNPEFGFRAPSQFDVFPGWRAFGYDAVRDIFGKATFYVSPTAKLNFTVIDYERENQSFDFGFLPTYDDQLDSPTIDTAADSAAIIGNRFNDRLFPVDFPDIVQSSARLNRNLYVGNWDHTIGTAFYKVAVGFFQQERVTCNYFEGVCLGDSFEDPNFTDDRFIGPVPGGRRTPATHPTTGTDNFFGGEKLETWSARGDVQWQATDHHNIQAGIFTQFHDLNYDEVENLGGNLVTSKIQRYQVSPSELAFYLQDRIEYDFLTVKLGFRVDRTAAAGTFFTNPLDPTNGTTAADVCDSPEDWQNVTVTVPVANEETGEIEYEPVTLSADPSWADLGPNCGGDPDVLGEAARMAFVDDFSDATDRWQFSPRIHVSFPVTSRSSAFFNFGRYSQNPLLRNLYQYTGVGTIHEGVPLGFFQQAGGQAEEFFGPYVYDPREDTPRLVGNPMLAIEKTTLYEIGFAAEIGDNFGVTLVLYNKDQTGLTGVRTGGQLPSPGGLTQVFDPGATYGTSTPNFPVLINQDFQSVRGFDISLRRRLADYWSVDLNYGFSRARTNAAEPERETQNRFEEFDPRLFREIPSEIDQPHRFNSVLRFSTGAEAPFWSGFKNSTLSFVFRAASGFPYTPTTTFAGTGTAGNLDRNSGRGPGTWQLDLFASKDFWISNVQYGLFLRWVNVFDTKNCVQVFTSTGDCDGGSPDQSRAREGNTFSANTNISSTFLDRPHYLGPRTSVNFGVRASF